MSRVSPTTTVCGAGSTLAASIYQLSAFAYSSKGVVSYTGVGSTQGKASATYSAVDFAGSDSPLSSSQYALAPDLQMYPSIAAAVVPVINIPQLGDLPLVLDRAVLPLIFLGDIYQWDDAAILALQSSATQSVLQNLTDKTIRVVVRDEGSGTTSIFTQALSLFSAVFASRIVAADRIDWCEDGMEAISCTSGTIVAGTCSINATKFNCFGPSELPSKECEGIAWVRDTGFSSSGSVTCAKPLHSGRQWTYYRGSQTVGLLAAVLQLEGSIGYAVLGDTTTLSMQTAQVKNKAGNVVSATEQSVLYALMELGGTLNAKGNAQLMDAASATAWPIASYTYFVLRKGQYLSSGTLTNVIPTGAAKVMYACTTRNETMKFLEWYYTSATVTSIGESLGFANLPSFISKSLISSMLGEVYCQDGATVAVAHPEETVVFQWVFLTGISSYLMDTYENVYLEVDPLVAWSYKELADADLNAALLKTGTYSDAAITTATLAAGLGIAHLSKSAYLAGSLPSTVTAVPLYSVGVAIVYHLKSVNSTVEPSTTMDFLGDVLVRQKYSFFELDPSTLSEFTAPTTKFTLVLRSDSCDTNEIITAALMNHFQCSGSGASLTFCRCFGSTPFRAFKVSYFDGSGPAACPVWDLDDLHFVTSDEAVEAAVTYLPAAIGFWSRIRSLVSIKSMALRVAAAPGGQLSLSSSSISACEDAASKFAVDTRFTLYDALLSTTPGCWPFTRQFAIVINSNLLGSNQCARTDFYPGVGASPALQFTKWLYSADNIASAITNLGLVAVTSTERATTRTALSYDCNPNLSLCAAGAFFDSVSSSCLACPSGSITASAGQTQCQICPPGTYERSRTSCFACATEEYQPLAGKTECLTCVANSLFLAASGDTTFPFVLKQGAVNQSQCACTENFYAPVDQPLGSVCLRCPVGGICKGTGLSERIVPVPTSGFYYRQEKPEMMLRCLTRFACPGGPTNKCGSGYTGDICSDCAQGYYSRSGECNKCDSANTAAAAIAIIMFVFISVVLHGIANIDRSGALMRSTTAAAAEVQSTILFLQIFNLLLVVQVEWPLAIRQLMQWFSWINIDVSVLSLECTWTITYTFGWRLKVLFPYFFAFFYCLYTLGFWAYYVLYKYRDSLYLALKECKIFVFKSVNASFLLLSILYISTTKTLLEAFACTKQPDGTTTMPLYPALSCSSYEYKTDVLPVASISLVTIALGYPLLLLIIFATGYDTMSEAVFISTQIVRAPFKKKFYFWEVIDLARKFVIAMLLSFGSSIPTGAQLATLSAVMITALVMQVSYRPFKHLNVNNLVVYIFSVLLFVLITAGMIFNQPDQEGSAQLKTALTFLTYFVVITAVLFSFINVVLSLSTFLRTRRTGEIVQHQVLVTPELLDTTVEQLRTVSSAMVIEQCKEIIDDEDMQRAFNDAVCLLFVLSTTSKRTFSSGSLQRRSTGKSFMRSESVGSTSSGELIAAAEIQRQEDSNPHVVQRAQSRVRMINDEAQDSKDVPVGLQHITATKMLNQFGSTKRMANVSKLSQAVKDMNTQEKSVDQEEQERARQKEIDLRV